MLDRILLGVDRWRLAVWVLLLPLLGVCLVGLARLTIEDSPERWMPRSSIKAWEVFDSHFDVGDTIAVGLEFSRPVTDADAELLAGLRREISQIEGIKQVYDPSLVAEEIEAVPLTELIDPANAERFPIYAGALWNTPAQETSMAAGRTLMIISELRYLPLEQADELNRIRRECVRRIYELADQRRADPAWQGIQLHVASGIVMMAELERRAAEVGLWFLPAAIVVGLVALMWGFRSASSAVVAAGGGLVAMLLVLGTLGLVGGSLGTITMTAPTLMAIVAIATTVHFCAYAADHSAPATDYQPGKSHRKHLIRWVAVPCLGAAVTTGVGFLMLAFNELQPIRHLGLQLFAGAILAFFGVFLVSQLLPIHRALASRLLTPDRLSHILTWQLRRPALLVGGLVLSMVALLALAYPRPSDSPTGLYVDADPFSFFSEDEPIAQALSHFSDREFGMYQLEVVLVPKDQGRPPENGVGKRGDDTFEANQQAADAFHQALIAPEAAPLGVARVISTQEFHARQQQFWQELDRVRREEGLWAAGQKIFRLAQHLDRFQQTFQSWNNDRLGQGAMRVTVLAHEQGPQGFRPLLDYVRDHLPRDRFHCYTTGAIVQIVHLSEGLVTGLVWGLGTSLLVMALLCLVLFRSWRLTAAAFLPNAFPLVAVFGLMGAAKLPISSGTAMLATVALGIALNDTIHFLLHYRQLTRDEHHAVVPAIDATMRHVGRPIVLTSLVHVAGFSIFLLTDFLPLFHFGLLGGVSMLAAIVGDLVLLPCLLYLLDYRAEEPSNAAEIAKPAAIALPSASHHVPG